MKSFHPKRFLRRIKQTVTDFYLYHFLPDRLYLSIKFRQDHGYKMNLKNPQTIDEKLQWIKLYDRKDIYHKMIDKITARDYIADCIGTSQYCIPLLGVWSHFDDIDFSLLPHQFVLKCNHDSASWIICKDKDQLDKSKARNKLEAALKINYYKQEYKQWGYDGIVPKILAEEYIGGDELIEYQIFCNNGAPVFFLVRTDLGESQGKGYNICYSLKWEKLDFRNDSFPSVDLPKPRHFDEMIMLAKKLSVNTLHLRVDFYESAGRLFIGEMTFYSNGGNFHNFNEKGLKALSESLTLPIES